MDSRRRVLAATLAEVLLLAGGCSRGGKNKKIEIVMVVKALDSEWWQRVKAGAEEAARADPEVSLAVLAPEREINIDQQVAILEDQIQKRVSAIAVAPTGAAEVIPVLEKARAARIPVLIMDTDVPWPPKLSYIGLDNRMGGRLAGEYIRRAIGGHGKVAVIRGVLGVATQDERLAGFRDAIATAPGIESVAVQPANSERALGMSVMENILAAHPGIHGVFATNDQMALGAMEAIAARHLTGKIVLVGYDATGEALRAVKAGTMSGSMAGYPERMAKRTVEETIKAARGRPVEKHVAIDTTLVTRENVADFLR